MRGLSSLSSALIGASVEDAKEDMTPEQAAAVKAAAERGRRRSVGEEERVVGEDAAAEEARQTALEAARQSAAKRTAEQTAEATAAELTSDGMEYDRLIHAHRSSIAREEGELARVVAAEVTEEVAREEAHAAAKRRASVREEEEVRPAHLARVLRLRSTGGGGGEPLPLCSRTTRPPHYAYHAGEAPAGGRCGSRGGGGIPPSRGVHCHPSARQHLTLAPTPRPNTSPPQSRPNFPPLVPHHLILPAPAQVHYGDSAKRNSKDSAPPALIKVESAVVPSDAGEDVHVPGEHEGQPDGWNVRLAPLEIR